MNVIRCAHCGTANRAGSYFCNRCGTDLRAQENFVNTPQDAETASLGTRWNVAEPDGGNETAIQPNESTETTTAEPGEHDSSNVMATSSTRATEAWQNPLPAEYQEHIAGSHQTDRLVDGIHGLLEPIRIASDLGSEDVSEQSLVSLPHLTIPVTQLRRVRTLIAEDPALVEHQLPTIHSAQIRLRYPWLITLLLLAIGIPLLLGLHGPVGEAARWPGVTEAYDLIDQLSSDNGLWIFWAYDPATAGEMDLVAQPLADHLLERNVQVTVFSLLPTGLATAQRLWSASADDLTIEEGIGVQNGRTTFIEGAYLPGGATALALVASNATDALRGHTERATSWLTSTAQPAPAAVVVIATHAEDVQHWLELAQTENHLPVVAFTSAGADPILRPYLASGQLTGLVTGFDGAAAYQQLRDRRFGRPPSARYTAQLIAQNWGHAALILLLILGNLRAIWLGGQRG